MKKIIKSLKTIALLGLILVISISCDNDLPTLKVTLKVLKTLRPQADNFHLLQVQKHLHLLHQAGLMT